MIYQHAGCDCKWCNASNLFKKYCTNNWRPFMSELLYVHQTFINSEFYQFEYYDIMTCPHVRCDYKLLNVPWFHCVFRGLSNIIKDYSCLRHCISTKLSQNVCLINFDFSDKSKKCLSVGNSEILSVFVVIYGRRTLCLRSSLHQLM